MSRFLLSLILGADAAASVIPDYFLIGFTHIFPHGWDHILFILGLFFLSRDLSVLLWQMTLFTIAHSLTLGLALYGIVDLPSKAVEITIALSISFVAIENLFARQRLSAWRTWIVFVFGLIHGLGFAHSFAGRSVPKNEFLPALFSFNLGVEAGQLFVIAAAYAVSARFSRRSWYPGHVVRPACLFIATVGLCAASFRLA